MNERELQIDHRIPFEIAGDGDKTYNSINFMLLSGSANRAKSWSCEHCENWNVLKDSNICLACYWAYPESYSHIAMHQIRRLDIMWQDKEIAIYEMLKEKSENLGKEIPEVVKKIIEIELTRN